MTTKDRIRLNTTEYDRYGTGQAWLDENIAYLRHTVNKMLEYHKYAKFKSFKHDFYQEAAIVVLKRFPLYNPGPRGINAWLREQIRFYIGTLISRKYIKYYERTVGGGWTDDEIGGLDPHLLLECKEDDGYEVFKMED